MPRTYCTRKTDAYIWLIEGFGDNVVPAGCDSSPRAIDQSQDASWRLHLDVARNDRCVKANELFHYFFYTYLFASEGRDMDQIVGEDE